MEKKALDTAEIVRNQVDQQDHDRFRVIILAPQADQRRLFALTALNIELSQCLSHSGESMLSMIKLQWWYDALVEAADGSVRNHPVLTELQHAEVDFMALLPLVEVRQISLESEAKPTLQSTLDYASATAGKLHQIMVDSQKETVRECALQIGTSWGLISLVRGILFQGAMQQDLIPDDILAEVSSDHQFTGDTSVVLETVGHNLLAQAEEKIAAARRQLKTVSLSKQEKCLMKLAILADYYCNRIKQGGFNPAQIDFDRGQFGLLLKLIFKSY